MGWWDRLRGRELPPRERGPEGEVAGPMKSGVKHGVWIEKGEDDWKYGLLECIYSDGVRQGPYRYWNLDGRLNERGNFVAGERDGEMERFAKDGWRLVAASYRAGKQHGMARAWNADGTLRYEREYRDGKRWSGLWSADRKGPESNPEGEYREGARVGVWRSWRRDGSIGAECDFGGDGVWRAGGAVITPADDEELTRWVALADAWSQFASPVGTWSDVESAVEAWPEEVRAQAVAWLGALIAERGHEKLPPRTAGGVGWGLFLGSDDDPRTWLLDGLSTDHNDWDAEFAASLARRAGVMRVLDLLEVDIDPGGVDALFPGGVAWPKLETLSLYECGSLARLVKTLARANWTGALTSLTLYDDEAAIAAKDAAALISSPHLGALRQLHLGPIAPGRSFASALATVPLLDRLEHLKLDFDDEQSNVLKALATRLTPGLREIELRVDGTVTREILMKLVAKETHPVLESLSLDGAEVPDGIAGEIAKLRPSLKLDVR